MLLGAGVTIHAQHILCSDSLGRKITVTDTPGLDTAELEMPGFSDMNSKDSAATEIEEALKSSGKFMKLNFVIGLSGGRVLPGDVQTINLVSLWVLLVNAY